MCWLLQLTETIFWTEIFKMPGAVVLAATDSAAACMGAILTSKPIGPNEPLYDNVMEYGGMPTKV
jgi:hypothetical protein